MKNLKTLCYLVIGMAVISSMSAKSYATGSISGTITNTNSENVSDAIVFAFSEGNVEGSDVTADDGQYLISGLAPATYEVHVVADGYVHRIEPNVVVTNNNNTVKNITNLAFEGIIAGKVTESDGITPIENAFVFATDSNGKLIASDTTDSNGDYRLAGLTSGTYTVTSRRREGPVAEVSSVSVTEGQTTDEDLSAAGGSISGTVRNSSQSPIQNGILIARRDGEMYKTTSDASGDYTIEALPAGTYQVTVDPNNNNYVASKIDDVTVVSGQDTSDQDFTLGQDGKITGTITDSSQDPIEGALILAIEPDDAENDPTVAFIPVITDASGNYTIAHLRTGTYTIYVSANNYVSDSETNVSVTAGQITSGKNFTLGTSGGTISGTVYESTGQTAISGALVSCGSDGKSWVSTLSDSNGNYSLTLLQAGTYEVTAHSEGYEAETLDNIVVTGTGENSGNDFTLDEEE